MDSHNEVSLSEKVIELLAEVEGVAPTDLDFSLYDEIDPDILDQLDGQTQLDWELVFEIQGHLVQVTSEGTVTLDEGIDESEPTVF